MKLNSAAGLLCSLLLTSCAADLTYDVASDAKSAYIAGWIKKFGLIDPNQNWNMATSVSVQIADSYFEDNSKVQIYSTNPRVGGRLIGTTSKAKSINIDVVKGMQTIYVRSINAAGEIISEGYVDIVDGNALVGKTLRAPKNKAMAPVEADASGVFDWTIACEDLGTADDYDFNDIVLGINHVSGDSGNKLYITPLAAGGVLDANIYVGEQHVGEIHEMLIPGVDHTTMINTYSWDGMGETIEVDVPSDWSIANNMGGIAIEVQGLKAKLEAPEPSHAPQLICIKGDWLWPGERQHIEDVYRGFKTWNKDAEDLTWLDGHTSNVIVWKTVVDNGNNDDEEDGPGIDTPTPTPTPKPDKSSDMISSQALNWTQGWKTNTTDNSKGKTWDYVPGLVTKATLTYCEQYPDEDNTATFYLWAKDYADNGINSDGSLKDGVFVKGSIDNIASGKVLLSLYKKTNEAKYLTAAKTMYDYLRGTNSSDAYPRIASGDAAGGFWHKTEYPNQMWLDGLYMGAAFYAEYQSIVNPDDAAAWDDITKQFTIIHSKTYDSSKQLNYHGWSAIKDDDSFWAQTEDHIGCSRAFWGRGMGWYAAALVDVLGYMPESNSNYNTLKGIYQQVAAGLLRWQDPTSYVWYQLIDEPASFSANGHNNYLEASASSMFTYALLKGLRLGLIDEATYRTAANNAYTGLLNTFITGSGSSTSINYICKSAGLGPSDKQFRDGSKAYYIDIDKLTDNGKNKTDVQIVSNEGKGIGAFIFAALEYELSQAQ